MKIHDERRRKEVRRMREAQGEILSDDDDCAGGGAGTQPS